MKKAIFKLNSNKMEKMRFNPAKIIVKVSKNGLTLRSVCEKIKSGKKGGYYA